MANQDVVLMRNAIVNNDHATIRAVLARNPNIDCEEHATACSECEFTTNLTILSAIYDQTQMSNFVVTTTRETVELLMELEILMPTNIKFLDDYITSCECPDKWRFYDEILPLFDRNAIRNYRSYWTENGVRKTRGSLINVLFYAFCKHPRLYEEFMRFVDMGVDPCVVTSGGLRALDSAIRIACIPIIRWYINHTDLNVNPTDEYVREAQQCSQGTTSVVTTLASCYAGCYDPNDQWSDTMREYYELLCILRDHGYTHFKDVDVDIEYPQHPGDIARREENTIHTYMTRMDWYNVYPHFEELRGILA